MTSPSFDLQRRFRDIKAKRMRERLADEARNNKLALEAKIAANLQGAKAEAERLEKQRDEESIEYLLSRDQLAMRG